MDNVSTLDDVVEVWTEPVSDWINNYFADLYDPSFRFPLDLNSAPPWKPRDIVEESRGDIHDLLQIVNDKLKDMGLCHDTPGNFAYVPNGVTFAASLAEYLKGFLDLTETEERLRQVVIQWLCKFLVGYKVGGDGLHCHGGTPSTTIAVSVARDTSGVEPEDYHRLVVYITGLTHFCLERALYVTGLGECVVRTVEHLPDQTMCPEALQQQIEHDKQAGLLPFMIGGSFGTCGSGSLDPIHQMALLADNYNMWLHVDACYGGFHLISDSIRQTEAASGLSRADSITLDAHKSLFNARSTSFVLLRAGVPDKFVEVPGGPITGPLEGVHTPRCFSFWFPFNVFGSNLLRDMVDKNLHLAQHLYEELTAISGIQTLMKPHLTAVLFRCRGDAPETANTRTKRLAQSIRDSGQANAITTPANNFVFVRIAINSSRNTADSVNKLVDLVRTLMERLYGEKTNTNNKPNVSREKSILKAETAFRVAEGKLRQEYTKLCLQFVKSNAIDSKKTGDQLEMNGTESLSFVLPKDPVSISQLLNVCQRLRRKEVSVATYAASVGHLLATMLNFHPTHNIEAPTAVDFEADLVRWLASTAGLSGVYQGALCCDNLSANILSFLSTRYKNIKCRADYDRCAVYLTQADSAYFDSSLDFINLRRCPKKTVLCDVNDVIDFKQLNVVLGKINQVRPMLLALHLTNDRQFKQLPEMIEMARQHGVWVHIDTDLALAHRNSGLEGADSLSLDMRDCLRQPNGTSLVLVNDVTNLKRSLSPRMHTWEPPSYDRSYFNPTEYLLESTRPCRGLPLVFTLKTLGSSNILKMLKTTTFC